MDACAYVGNKISQAISSRKVTSKDEELEPKKESGRTCMLRGSKPKQNGAAHYDTEYTELSKDPPPYSQSPY